MNTNLDSEHDLPEAKTETELVTWKNPPILADLKQEFTDAKIEHDLAITKVAHFLDVLNITGSVKLPTKIGRSNIQPKLVRKSAEWRYSSLSESFLSNDDIFLAKPVTWEDDQCAKDNTLVLNNQFNTKIDKIKFFDSLVRALVNEGTAIVRVGWEYKKEEVLRRVPIFKYEFATKARDLMALKDIIKLKYSDPEQFEMTVPNHWKEAIAITLKKRAPVVPKQHGFTENSSAQITLNQPTVELVDLNNVYVDPTCNGNMDNALFVINCFQTNLAELTALNVYVNLDSLNSSALNTDSDDFSDVNTNSSDFYFKDKPRKKFTVYEYWGYWDLDGSGMVQPIVCAWAGDTIIRLEKNPYPDGKPPFVAIQYLPRKNSIYGDPDGMLIEDNQAIIGATKRGMIDILARSAAGQRGMRKDALDILNKRRYNRGDDYDFNPNVDPRALSIIHTFPEMPVSAMNMIGMENAEAESLTGVKAYSSGIGSQALGDVATGIRGSLDAASKRELGIVRRIGNGVCQIGRKFIAMNSVYLEEEEIVRITSTHFATIKRDDLAGNIDLSLTISTAEVDEAKLSKLSFLLQTIGNSMDAEIRDMVLTEICSLLKMPALSKKISDYAPTPDPVAQKKAELEIEKLQAEIVNVKADTANKIIGSKLDANKIDTEVAKSTKTKSEADLIDLNYIEQATGTTQERDKEKLSIQAKANTEMKIIEAALEVAVNNHNIK